MYLQFPNFLPTKSTFSSRVASASKVCSPASTIKTMWLSSKMLRTWEMTSIRTAYPTIRKYLRNHSSLRTSAKFSWKPSTFLSPKSIRKKNSGMPPANRNRRRKRSTGLNTTKAKRSSSLKETMNNTMNATTTTDRKAKTALTENTKSVVEKSDRSKKTNVACVDYR